MYVRLAFAVAAHLESEILLVDEVLAVGDSQFQKKCLNKMRSVVKSGRTVVFVSHNMNAINTLCNRAILLKNGEIVKKGLAQSVVNYYLKSVYKKQVDNVVTFPMVAGKLFQVSQLFLSDTKNQLSQIYTCDQDILIRIKLSSHLPITDIRGILYLEKNDGTTVLVSESLDKPNNPLDNLKPGTYSLVINIPKRMLSPGEYFVSLHFMEFKNQKRILEKLDHIYTLEINDLKTRRGNNRPGFFSTILDWQLKS